MQREVEALEALVDRYQEELEHSRSTMRDPLVDGDTCAHASLIGVTEEVYEHQRLYPSGWLSDLHTSDPPATASASGDPKSFDSVSGSIGKSADVLHQTEQLLDQILGGHGLSAIEVEETLEAQRRRSQMVEECQNELEGAVAEFQHMLVSADERKEPSALPGRPPRI
ncbi:TPA: hypothetical protein N0F65_008476 [Lagenidium giganteum]|uniref:Uncharacterized protein n=1 Tax=Lagenidium giganteum TaxID=4803 RepID=A0AAV2Z1I9_9STRA|nr:TPA: hypothetical protein N0F65_008476 [Lagenidium giganteum]